MKMPSSIGVYWGIATQLEQEWLSELLEVRKLNGFV
jgi:hypothetical protein